MLITDGGNMGIDLLQSRDGYERVKWYGHTVTNGNKITRSDTVEGVLYVKDVGENTTENVRVNDIQGKQQIMTLETKDESELGVNDFILYDDVYWLVTMVNPKDVTKTREFSKRPSTDTTINVRRYV